MKNIISLLIIALIATHCFAVTRNDAKWIGAGKSHGNAPVVVRGEVVNVRDVKRAIWRTSGLGVYTAYVNGRQIGSGALRPGFTTAAKRRQEAADDVTSYWNKAAGEKNELSALVTSGWWCDDIMGKFGGTWPAFRGVLELEYYDGSHDTFVTDESWLASISTPVVQAGIWEGETYDARIEPNDWKKVEVSNEFDGEVSPWIGPEIVYRDDLTFAVNETGFKLGANEKKIIDFGQNCAAVPELTVEAKPGTKVKIRLGEMLNDGIKGHNGDGPAGSLYTANMRGAKSAVDYVCKGEGAEVFRPQHTFYGYRYAEISADAPIEGKLVSIPVTSVSKEVEHGKIVTGDESVNRLVKNAYWGMLSNYLSVPTDCPQRTERLGWTGDTQVFVKTAAYFADVRGFFRKWMQDVRDAQHKDGVIPLVVPKGRFGDTGPIAGWGDAGIIVPWTMWKYLGDENAVRENWDAMVKYLRFIEKIDYTVKRGVWLLCDWLSYERLTVDQSSSWSNGKYTEEHLSYQNYLNACYMLQDIAMMREMSAKIKGLAAVEGLDSLEKRTRERLLANWFKPDGTLVSLFDNMQTPRIYAIKLGLGDTAKLGEELAGIVRDNGNRLSTGFLGTPYLCEVLSNIGETELAYSVLLSHDFPSWLYTVDQGATTCWERWDSYTKEKGFGDVKMNSFNHYAYGAVVGWLFETAGGLKPGPDGGWKTFTIAPKPDKRLGSCRVEFDGGYGKIVSEWHYEGDEVKFSYSVPDGCEATIIPPSTR